MEAKALSHECATALGVEQPWQFQSLDISFSHMAISLERFILTEALSRMEMSIKLISQTGEISGDESLEVTGVETWVPGMIWKQDVTALNRRFKIKCLTSNQHKLRTELQ